jgi:trimethylamine--corrinoid protein Co-methyltransferase
MTQEYVVQPELSFLQPEQIAKIHEASLRILADVGVRVDSARARSVISKASGMRLENDPRVRFPREVVEWAIETSPSAVKIFDRLGNPAFTLGASPIRFGVGVTNLFYQDPSTEELFPFTRKHMETCVRLGDALNSYDLISTIGVLQDLPPSLGDLYATLEMVANTQKPLIILISEENLFGDVLDMLEHLTRELASKPFVIPYFNPITPLVINEGTSRKMLETIDRGLPLIYVTYGMAGVSTPITALGAMALLNSELLAGLTLAQMARQGTPVILGSLPFSFDMGALVDIFDMRSVLLNLAFAEMMDHYQIPFCGLSGSGSGWGPDILAAEEILAVHLTSCLGKVSLAPFVGSNLSSKAFSPASAVYGDEVIANCRRLEHGFPIDERLLGLEDVARVGPGGTFLTCPSTRAGFRESYLQSEIFPTLSMEKWQRLGQPSAAQYLRDHTCQLLEQLREPEDHDELICRGEAFIKRRQSNG